MKIPLKRAVLALLIPGTMLIVSACNFFAPQNNQPLDLLDANPAATEVAALRATATVEIDRQNATLDAINTAVRAVDVQSTRIAATLIGRGTPFIDISGLTPLAPTQSAGSSSGTANIESARDPAIVPLVTPGGGAQGNVALTPVDQPQTIVGTPTQLPGAQPPPAATNPPVQANTSQSQLTQITFSRAVGANDCPTAAETTFTTADTEIYVTAVAQVSAGSTIVSRWLRDGAEIASYDWTPDFDIQGACIWFYIPASSIEFVPGSWTVELTINGNAAGSASFTITSS